MINQSIYNTPLLLIVQIIEYIPQLFCMIPLISHIKSYQITYNTYFINKSQKKCASYQTLDSSALVPYVCSLLMTICQYNTNNYSSCHVIGQINLISDRIDVIICFNSIFFLNLINIYDHLSFFLH